MPQLSRERMQEILSRMQNHPLLENKTSRVKGCIFGSNGVGKTTAAVGLLRKIVGPDKIIVIVDYNEGYESLRKFPQLMKNVLPIPYEDFDQLYVIAQAIYYKQQPFENVGGIIIDDMDFITQQELIRLWHKRVVEQPQSKLDPDKPERPEYLKLGFSVVEVFDFLSKQTPDVHILITAHEYKAKAKDSDVVIGIGPGFNPAVAKEIAGRLQFVVYMTAKEIKRQDNAPQYIREIQAHPTALVDCKTRIGCDKVRYTATEFVNHVAEWSMHGLPEDKEADALLKDIESRAANQENFFGSEPEVGDDDEPVVVS